jgi:transposase
MTAEEELIHLRQENKLLREQARVHQETISLQRELITRQQEQITLLERELSLQQEQMTQFAEQVKALQERLAKDSHNSHLPPSADRFSRQPKSLRKKSGKKPGGQQGHRGETLLFSPCPDEVIVHPVSCCEHCQSDLQAVPPLQIERRQVVDVPVPQLIVPTNCATSLLKS